MSLFDLPRLHFAGTATTQLPTGPRGGLVDLATNTALTPNGRPFPADRPAGEYHDILDRTDPGPGPAKGQNFGGSGHFAVDARMVGAELSAGTLITDDPVIGGHVDMWGHYNEYFATTANRARVFDIDPSSHWTTTLMVGQFCFGRQGRSHDVGYLFTGDVEGFQPPRWQVFDPHINADVRPSASRLPSSSVHQFVVTGDGALHWLEQPSRSAVVTRLRDAVETAGADGIVVQFALHGTPAAAVPEQPVTWQLRGTVAPWRADEPRSYPAGRLLTAQDPPRPHPSPVPRQVTVDVGAAHVTFNLVAGPPGTLAVRAGEGETWELRTAHGDHLVAELPTGARTAAEDLTSGVLTVPRQPRADAAEHEALCLVRRNSDGTTTPLLSEREVNIQADDACIIVDHPDGEHDDTYDVRVSVLSLIRGRPGPLNALHVRQYANPRALPRDEAARSPRARCADIDIVRLRPDLPDSPVKSTDWAAECTISTDVRGRGAFVLRGARPGCARILLTAAGEDPPADPSLPGSAAVAYDNDDRLGYWAGAGHLSVRVLPDDWWLADVPQDQVTFDLVHAEVFAFYEHMFAFMKDKVFSLADQFRVDTYARLIWQMSDPENKPKTYYMPPTRDLSEPKARLLLAYLRVRNTPDQVLTTSPATTRTGGGITTRRELVSTLRHAAMIELAVTLQYLYAAYSLPLHGAGLEYVRQGQWTEEQLRIVSGDGGKTLDDGIRNTLLRVAREEMIHFLVVNNIVMALGEPFHFPAIDFGTLNGELLVPLDFSLEGLDIGSVQRFIAIESPHRISHDVRYGALGGPVHGPRPGPPGYASLSDLYAAVREALQRIPGLFMVDRGRGGGEHHVFLRKSVNTAHPDYQLEVDDLSSALFAVDFITEQGEGQILSQEADPPSEECHFDAFLRISDLLMNLRLNRPPGHRPAPDFAYPVLRNPTLTEGTGIRQVIVEPTAREVARLCNGSYFMMAQLMVQHFGEQPDASLRRSELMNYSIDLMNGVLQPLAELLAVLPSGVPGRTAGAPFALERAPEPLTRPDVARRVFARRCTELARTAREHPVVPARVADTLSFLADRFGAY
ncbi:ferritin-like domain-containing protein [Streptomyces sp. NBC_01014]|uniref:ferritin-like domain-containing protein n=1 Tax=Streptomyces sp. NBC_01014 TaxID=2903719 RepID=UPI0038708914|nr:ferritin-like protein [Streptomyces sp. NBC_01014]